MAGLVDENKSDVTFSTDLLFGTGNKDWTTVGGTADLVLQSDGCCEDTDAVMDGNGKLKLGPRACKWRWACSTNRSVTDLCGYGPLSGCQNLHLLPYVHF